MDMNIEQIRQLIENGLSAEEAAESLGLDADAVKFALKGSSKQVMDVTKMVDEFRPMAINILKDIAIGSENDHARVRAIQILMEGKGIAPQTNVSALSERFKMMKEAIKTIREKSIKDARVIDVEPITDNKNNLQLATA